MSYVHSWPSAWFASMVLQVEISVTEGLGCTCIGNRMTSLIGREAAMPAKTSAPIVSSLDFFDCPFGELLQGVSYFS